MGGTLTRSWRVEWPLHLRATVGPLQQGPLDPCLQLGRQTDGHWLWWARRMSSGPTTLWVSTQGRLVEARAWGDGAAEILDRLPRMLGSQDTPDGFDVARLSETAWHPRVVSHARRWARQWRAPASGDLIGGLVTAVLGQRVTGGEAHAAWRTLVRQVSAAAPAPDVRAPALYLPPTPQQWLSVPSWQWQAAGVDGQRRNRLIGALSSVTLLDYEHLDAVDVRKRLRAIPGIGVWTDAVVGAQVFGDADAVPFGDFHVCHDTVYALTGAARSSDAELAAVLQPWAGHRFRVVRLVQLCAISAPRWGPRYRPLDLRRF